MLPRTEVLGRDQIAAVEFGTGIEIPEHIILPARLRTRATIGAALGDHPGHIALTGVRDAQRAMDERLETERRHGGANAPDVVQRVLAREDHARDAEPLHHARAGPVVDGHLRGPVDLERRIHTLDEADQPDILDDRGIDAAVDALAEIDQRVVQLARLDQDIEREVDPRPALVGHKARLLEFVERELGAFIPRVEVRGTTIDGVGAVGDGRPHGIERAGGGEEFGDRAWEGAGHPRNLTEPCALRARRRRRLRAVAADAVPRAARPSASTASRRTGRRTRGRNGGATVVARNGEWRR